MNDLVKRKRVGMVKIEVGNVCCFLLGQISVKAVLGKVDDYSFILLQQEGDLWQKAQVGHDKTAALTVQAAASILT